jgi:hypothetical protein
MSEARIYVPAAVRNLQKSSSAPKFKARIEIICDFEDLKKLVAEIKKLKQG